MSRFALRFAAALAFAFLAVLTPAGAAEPAPPTDSEITKLIAVFNGISGDAGRAEEMCAVFEADDGEEKNRTESLAQTGRRAEAHPILGPLLRRHGLSGERFVVVSAHVAGALFGLGFADELDAAAKERGEAGGNRAKLLAENAEVKLVAARQAEVTAALSKVQVVCGEDEEEEEEEEVPEDEMEEEPPG
jgi:hypothetical protein